MEQSWYARCQEKLQVVSQGYDAMLDGLDQYGAVLGALKQEVSGDDTQREFIAWLDGQIRRVSQLTEVMETDVTDQFIRFYDRNVRVRHWEEERFV